MAALFSISGRALTLDRGFGKQISFLPIPRSSGRENFMKNATKTNWPKMAAELSSGAGMSASESAALLREYLDASVVDDDDINEIVSCYY